jgi:hypothetical protein
MRGLPEGCRVECANFKARRCTTPLTAFGYRPRQSGAVEIGSDLANMLQRCPGFSKVHHHGQQTTKT